MIPPLHSTQNIFPFHKFLNFNALYFCQRWELEPTPIFSNRSAAKRKRPHCKLLKAMQMWTIVLLVVWEFTLNLQNALIVGEDSLNCICSPLLLHAGVLLFDKVTIPYTSYTISNNYSVWHSTFSFWNNNFKSGDRRRDASVGWKFIFILFFW